MLCDKLISDNDLETYDAIVLPGGMPGSTNLRDNEKVQSLIKKYNKENKIVAGPLLVIMFPSTTTASSST